jgi:hypothetical protein
MRSLMHNAAFDEALERDVYSQPALVPASPWLGDARLKKPVLRAGPGASAADPVFNWSLADGEKPWLWVLQMRISGGWHTEILPANQTSRSVEAESAEVVAISAVDRNGNESPAAAVQVKR